jgi:hypothetical protein
MNQLHISKIHITLVVKVSHAVLAQHLASSPGVVGEMLTNQIAERVNEQKLGYFPALDFFQQQGSVDADLLDAAQTIGWFSARYAREEIQRRLRPFFSTISFQSVHTQAFSLPPVRPNQLNAWQALCAHYTPDTVKIDIIASVLKKQNNLQGLANWAKQLFARNLDGVFEKFEVIQTIVIDA